MLGIIIGSLVLIAIIATVICCVVKTPINLRGFYGAMFWTIGIIAIVGISAVVIVGLI